MRTLGTETTAKNTTVLRKTTLSYEKRAMSKSEGFTLYYRVDK